MKRFNESFKTRLYETIETIENNSLVEIVVIIKPQSDRYQAASLKFGITFLILVYSFLMFSHFKFDVFLIYAFSIFSFFIAYVVAELVPALKKLFINKKHLIKQSEIIGRAIFQKGGIRFTNDRIGVLYYVSLFEKKVQ